MPLSLVTRKDLPCPWLAVCLLSVIPLLLLVIVDYWYQPPLTKYYQPFMDKTCAVSFFAVPIPFQWGYISSTCFMYSITWLETFLSWASQNWTHIVYSTFHHSQLSATLSHDWWPWWLIGDDISHSKSWCTCNCSPFFCVSFRCAKLWPMEHGKPSPGSPWKMGGSCVSKLGQGKVTCLADLRPGEPDLVTCCATCAMGWCCAQVLLASGGSEQRKRQPLRSAGSSRKPGVRNGDGVRGWVCSKNGWQWLPIGWWWLTINA